MGVAIGENHRYTRGRASASRVLVYFAAAIRNVRAFEAESQETMNHSFRCVPRLMGLVHAGFLLRPRDGLSDAIPAKALAAAATKAATAGGRFPSARGNRGWCRGPGLNRARTTRRAAPHSRGPG